MQVINLPPIAPTLIESTRAIGYSLEAAVADVIDNSIAAQANKIEISFFPLDGAFISIFDNGNGMDSDEITRAMQYGSQNPLNIRNSYDLGRFGLGLKTASLSQCRTLTVVSKKNNIIHARRWDIDYVQNTGEWSLLVLEDDEIVKIPSVDQIFNCESGTLVVWQNLDRMGVGSIDFAKSMGKQIDFVREHLSLVYHRYLTGEQDINKIEILINGEFIEPSDPFLIKKSDQTMQEEVYLIHGEKIKVQPYILPHISKMTSAELKAAGGRDGLRKLQGFYVYRNKRLLVWGTWFRMMRKGELSKLARIRVDIPNSLDDLWTLDIKKSAALPPEEVRNNLSKVIDRIGNKSKIKFTHRGKLEVDDNEMHMWNRMKNRDGGYYYQINREHPMISSLCNKLGNSGKMLDTVLEQIERTIPLNQLYVDLNGDEHISNDAVQKNEEIILALRNMITGIVDVNDKLEFLNKMKDVPPYNGHPNEILDVIEEIEKTNE